MNEIFQILDELKQQIIGEGNVFRHEKELPENKRLISNMQEIFSPEQLCELLENWLRTAQSMPFFVRDHHEPSFPKSIPQLRDELQQIYDENMPTLTQD